MGVSSSGSGLHNTPLPLKKLTLPRLYTTLLEPHRPLSSMESGLYTSLSDLPESVTEADSSGRILEWGGKRPQLRKCTHPGRARGTFAGLMRACVLFAIAAAVRSVMAGVREAATLAVYRQIAVLFTAAQASLGGSETSNAAASLTGNRQSGQ